MFSKIKDAKRHISSLARQLLIIVVPSKIDPTKQQIASLDPLYFIIIYYSTIEDAKPHIEDLSRQRLVVAVDSSGVKPVNDSIAFLYIIIDNYKQMYIWTYLCKQEHINPYRQ